eukprot:3912244-Pyramimonas_sp.AAC.2
MRATEHTTAPLKALRALATKVGTGFAVVPPKCWREWVRALSIAGSGRKTRRWHLLSVIGSDANQVILPDGREVGFLCAESPAGLLPVEEENVVLCLPVHQVRDVRSLRQPSDRFVRVATGSFGRRVDLAARP